jgi:hypothetical protein
MNREIAVKFIQKIFWTVSCFLLLGAVVPVLTGCGNHARAKSERETTAQSGKIASALAGKWHKIQGNRFAEYARYAENLGDFETYEITADGRVRYESLTAAKNYDCRIETAAKSAGTITPDSETELNITLDVGTLEHTDACSPAKNYAETTKATTTDYQWKIGKDENGIAQLCLTQANGETTCYRREE